jgi:hypothetical protein
MNHLVSIIFFSLVLIIVACSNQNELEEPTPIPTAVPSVEAATPLPTAVQPDGPVGGSWAVTFRYDFPESYWRPGDHSFGFLIECPDLAYDFSTEWLIFKATEEVDHIPIPVYLRLNGLSVEPFSPAYMQQSVIHPDQDTAAVVHLVGLSEEQAEEAWDECEALIAWDQSSPKAMEPVDVFKP